jgi:hypothetical protein
VMAKAISGTEKKGRGRPRVNPTSIHLSVKPDQLAALDNWIARHPDPKPSRPEAIRRMMVEHLAGERLLPSRPDLRKGRRDKGKGGSPWSA